MVQQLSFLRRTTTETHSFKLSEPEKFNKLQNLLTTKVNKLAMKKLLKVTQGSDNFHLLDQAQLVTEAMMNVNRDTVWDN